MKKFLKSLLAIIVVLLWMGGIVCGFIFASQTKSVAVTLSTIALGVLAFPTVKMIVLGMNDGFK